MILCRWSATGPLHPIRHASGRRRNEAGGAVPPQDGPLWILSQPLRPQVLLPSSAMRHAARLLLLVLALAPVARAAEVLPFIDDDYAKALTMARAKHLPIFVDAWAPW